MPVNKSGDMDPTTASVSQFINYTTDVCGSRATLQSHTASIMSTMTSLGQSSMPVHQQFGVEPHKRRGLGLGQSHLQCSEVYVHAQGQQAHEQSSTDCGKPCSGSGYCAC